MTIPEVLYVLADPSIALIKWKRNFFARNGLHKNDVMNLAPQIDIPYRAIAFGDSIAGGGIALISRKYR